MPLLARSTLNRIDCPPISRSLLCQNLCKSVCGKFTRRGQIFTQILHTSREKPLFLRCFLKKLLLLISRLMVRVHPGALRKALWSNELRRLSLCKKPVVKSSCVKSCVKIALPVIGTGRAFSLAPHAPLSGSATSRGQEPPTDAQRPPRLLLWPR